MRRLPLARLPTPIEPLPGLSRAIGADIWIKRDDLTGFELSGNKVRKLEFLLQEAIEHGADTILTTGGMQSNHARATAAACCRLGLRSVLLLRGEQPDPPESNVLLDRLFGAEIVTCTADEYRNSRDAILATLSGWHEGHGRRTYIIPEGGSNAVGALGYALAAEEVDTQVGRPFDAVFVAVGSGGTLAGLAMGPDIGPLIGVAVCDDAAYFDARIRQIGKESAQPLSERWRVIDGYKGPAYGVADDATWASIRDIARSDGIIIDPVYTGKAMAALIGEVRAGRAGKRVLFWHTGGGFGLFGRGAEMPL